ncbi:hypothetical protein BDZ97DRAFT_1430280 [Flammula alnicola]|nr:hypothetical protein BDZ97DRAFT_1430280 [Flammula alnicola]
MFNLIRRISYGVIPRPDRPWEEDPTSNAPNTRRKRRLSSTERDATGDEEQANKKKARGESATPSVVDAEGTSMAPAPQGDTKEVKEVTQGVEEVALDGKDDEQAPAAPESIPLPEEKSGELDEEPTDATPPEAAATEPVVEESQEVAAEESSTLPADDASDVASSSAEDADPPKLEESVKLKKPLSSVKSTTAPSAQPDATKD